jgi:predicted alpha/beta-hydrolase family hydrolase
MRSAFMAGLASRLAAAELRVLRFEFPYMRAATRGRPRPPDPPQVLTEAWRAALRRVREGGTPAERLVIGGKSLGGRIASLIADDERVAGLICMGYPFHPPGRPDRLRTGHLHGLRTPTLICQGERDPFGDKHEVSVYLLSPRIEVCWIPDGDHGFRPRATSGRSAEANLDLAAHAAVRFVESL